MKDHKLTRRKLAKRLSTGILLILGTSISAKTSLSTPPQVEGPFHPIQDQFDTDLDLTRIKGRSDQATGEIILVQGFVRASSGKVLPYAQLDIWQANHHGRYSHPGDRNTAPLDPAFQGWGLLKTDYQGKFQFKTIMPGPYPLAALGQNTSLQNKAWRCRHIHFKVSASKYKKLTTQMYFRDDPLIPQDFEFNKAPVSARDLLIADVQLDKQSGLPLYQFDIILDSA